MPLSWRSRSALSAAASCFSLSACARSPTIFARRASSVSSTGPHAYFLIRNRKIRKPTIWVATCLKSIRLPMARPLLRDLAREDEHRDERVDRERFAEREAEDHRGLDLRRRFRLATHRLEAAL